MEHTFKTGDIAYSPIYGQVRFVSNPGIEPAYLIEIKETWGMRYSHSIDENGRDMHGRKLIYHYPVQVVPVPEFEEGEEIEVSDKENFKSENTTTGIFVSMLNFNRYGFNYLVQRDEDGFCAFEFARKIKKEEKQPIDLKTEFPCSKCSKITPFPSFCTNPTTGKCDFDNKQGLTRKACGHPIGLTCLCAAIKEIAEFKDRATKEWEDSLESRIKNLENILADRLHIPESKL